MLQIKRIVALWRAAFDKWSADNASVNAAAIAFLSGLSLAPLLIFAVALAGFVLRGADVQAALLAQAEAALGAAGRDTVAAVLTNAQTPAAGIVASAISLATLIWSASGLFGQFQATLNAMWRVPAERTSGIVNTLLIRLRALLMVLAAGAVLIGAALTSVAISAINQFAQQAAQRLATAIPAFSPATWAWLLGLGLPLIDLVLSLAVLTLLFGWLFSAVPRTPIGWRDVRGGALWTALLFVIGKWGLAWYLGSGSVGSAYGAAGALLVVLVWVYYTVQIVLLGVAYSYVDAHTYGARRPGATAATPPVSAPAPSAPPPAPSAGDPRPPATPEAGGVRWWLAGAIFLLGLLVGARDTRVNANRARRRASS